MRQPDRPKRLGDEALHAQVALDNEAQRGELARAVADDFPVELGAERAQAEGLEAGEGGAEAQVELDARGDGADLELVEVDGLEGRAEDMSGRTGPLAGG